MLSPEVEIVDVDPVSWHNLFQIFRPEKQERQLFILHDGGKVLRVWDSEKKLRSDIEGPITDAPALAEGLLEEDRGLARVFIYDTNAVRELFMRVRSPEYDDMDLDEYRQMIKGLIKTELSSGVCIRPPLGDWYDTCYEGFQELLSRLPSPSSLVVGIFDSGREFTSLILSVEGGKVKRISTFDVLVPDGHEPRSEPEDFAAFASLLEARFPPIAFAVFTDSSVASRVVSSTDPLALLRDACASGEARIPVGAALLEAS
jgi:hypothetical protein